MYTQLQKKLDLILRLNNGFNYLFVECVVNLKRPSIEMYAIIPI